MLLFSNLTIRSVFFTLLYFGICSSSFSQSTYSCYGSTGIGNLAPHKSTVNHLQQNPSFKTELGWNIELDDTDCHYAYFKPVVGVMVQFAKSGNTDVIGNIFSISTYGLLPLYEADYPLYFGAGYGVGYIQKPFDINTNPTNNAIGSHFNVNILIMLQKEYKISRNLKAFTRLGISHYSNATIQTPNLGLNYAYFSLGLKFDYLRSTAQPIWKLTEEIDLPYSLWNTSISAVIGIKENEQPLGDSYGIYGLSIQQEYRKSFKSSWIGSLDLFQNNAIKTISGKGFQPGIHLAYFLNFDRLRLGIGLGTYLMNAPKVGRIYNKVTIDHRIGKKLNFQLQLKSHWAAADFITAGVQYSIK